VNERKRAPAPGWPEGFYRAPEGLAAWVVVLPELPKTRETLPLRLFGDERTRRSLPQEIAAQEAGDPMGPVVRGMLKTWVLWVRGQLQAAVGDLCELLGIVLTAEQQAHLEALDLAGLAALRAHLKQHRAWPAS
jgi:hypothetical protein